MPTLDITKSQLMESLQDFALEFATPALVDVDHAVIGFVNNATPPKDGNDFVVITPLSQTRVGTNAESDDDPTSDTVTLSEYVQCEIQLDCYSRKRKNARLRAQTYETIARSGPGARFFRRYGIDCQFASPCQNLTAVMDSGQYVSRWTTTLTVGFWKQVSTGQDYFTDVKPELVNVDIRFKP
nr:MAG TPA: tail completion protein [Caudoviricetes sp.]